MKTNTLLGKVTWCFPALALLLVSCSNSGDKASKLDICKIDTISFKADILPIFENNCFSCHNEENNARKADGNKMIDYSDIKKYLDQDLIIGNIEHQSGFIKMPYKKQKLDSCDIEKIKAWVATGAFDN